MVSRAERDAMEAYLLRCLALLDDVRGVVPRLDVLDAESLMKHGEPVEGISNLAWAIDAAGVDVPPQIEQSVKELTAGWLSSDDLPPRFRESS